MNRQILKAIVFIFICFPSCKRNREWESAAKIVSEWTGREIKFPQGISCTSLEKDTACADLFVDNFKIVLYVDSIGCTSCKLSLANWKKIISESDSVFGRKPEFVFFFHPKKKDERELQSIFQSNGFRHPVFIDKENEIGKLNRFPSNPDYQCFLLDADNRVIMIGNPANNTGIWVLYKRIITERSTKLLTMRKGGEFFNANENTTLPAFPSNKEGGSAKNTKLI
jgi:hypothetical protein